MPIRRITGLDTFEELFVSLVFTFEEMSMNLNRACNRDTSSKASSFFKLVSSFDFIVSLVITRCIFDVTLPVTQLLQAKTIVIRKKDSLETSEIPCDGPLILHRILKWRTDKASSLLEKNLMICW